MEENKARQLEEIEALSSIYADDVEIEDENNYSVRISEGGTVAVLYIKLEAGYPSEGPPVYTLSSPSISTQHRRSICNELERVYLENIGECVVFLWTEEIRTFLQALPSSEKDDAGERLQSPEKQETATICDELSSLDLVECPSIFTGQSFEDRKSVFQGHVAVVTSVDQVQAVLRKLYENKKIAHASHNMYAYRIYVDSRKAWLQDCEDDGETAAGGRMLHLLDIMEAKNILVVVSRWYGGILLGPDRFKHINNAARQVLEESGLITQQERTKKKKK